MQIACCLIQVRVAPGLFLLLFSSRSGVFPIVSCCRGRAMCGASIGEDSSCCRSIVGVGNILPAYSM